MIRIRIPCGINYLEEDIPANKLEGILVPKHYHASSDVWEEQLVLNALNNPIGSPRLKDLVKDKRRIVIIIGDYTRMVPSRMIVPMMLAEIRSGNKHINVIFLVATSCHQPPTRDELIDKFGEYIVNNEKIIIHNAKDQSKLAYAGKLPSGCDFFLNRLALETDLICAYGIIEPHYLTGFSGGRDSILPGIAGWDTIVAIHNAAVIDSEKVRPGILADNPLNKDMSFAAKTVKLDFILNLALDINRKIIKGFAGNPELAFSEGCGFVGGLSKVNATPADIVITSCGGYPFDRDIYQSVQGLIAAEAACRVGGVIIMCAACNNGHGNEVLYRRFADASSTEEVMAQVMVTTTSDTAPDQLQVQILGRVLIKQTVIVVSDQCDHQLIMNMHMKAVNSLSEALQMAEEIVGTEARITIIPDGLSVIVN